MATTEYTPLNFAQRAALTGSLNPKRVSSRKQGSSSLSYLEAWDVKASLIKVFGFAGFSADVTESKIERILTKQEHGGNATWVVLATATVRLTIHQTGATYTEAAASSQAGSQIGEVADFALKTAESDALKRCAIYLGTQFGLSLYNKGATVDVVGMVLAPKQEWPATPEETLEHNAMLENRQKIIDEMNAAWAEKQGQLPVHPEQPQQQVQQGGPNPIQNQQFAPSSNITPDQRAANEALLARAMSARQAKDAEQQVDQQPDGGQAAALEE